MKARLLAKADAAESIDLLFAERATIGRAGDNSLALSASAVSSHHAEIVFDPETRAYFLSDLDSLNGTELDGIRVKRRERLGKLHAINLGDAVDLIFVTLDTDPETDSAVEREAADDGKTSFDRELPVTPEGLLQASRGSEGTRVERVAVVLPEALGGGRTGKEPEARKADRSRPVSPSGFFLQFDGPIGRRELGEGENLVGRLKSANVCLESRDLSRRHATVTVAGNRVLVRDEGSRNHTFVDGERLEDEVEVGVGSVLHFGRLAARLERRQDDAGSSPEEEPEGNGRNER